MGIATTLYNEVSLISLKILEISFRIYYTYLKPRNTRFFISKKEDHDSFKSSALQITYFSLIKKTKQTKNPDFGIKLFHILVFSFRNLLFMVHIRGSHFQEKVVCDFTLITSFTKVDNLTRQIIV